MKHFICKAAFALALALGTAVPTASALAADSTAPATDTATQLTAQPTALAPQPAAQLATQDEDASAYSAAFSIVDADGSPSGVASASDITVYQLKGDYSSESAVAFDGTNAYPRAKKSTELDISGEGQLNFSVAVPDGYTVEIAVSDESPLFTGDKPYNKVDDRSSESGIAHTFGITKVCAKLNVTVTVAPLQAFEITDKQAPKAGDVLEVPASSVPSGAVQSWYVDDELVGTGPSLELADDMYGHFVRTKVELDGKPVLDEDGAALADELFFSDLPVVYLNTDDGEGITSKTDYKHAAMSIQGNAEFKPQYDGGVNIRGRGNTTWERGLKYGKKPYKIKLDDKADLFEMGKNKHWVLLANFLDPSLMRNVIAQDLGRAAGLEPMDSVWVDVVLNGAYQGNYQLGEQVRVGSTRVDIFDWEGLAEDLAKAFYKKTGASAGMSTEDRDALEEKLATNLMWVSDGKFMWNGKTYRAADYVELPSGIEGGYLFELSDEYDEATEFTTASGYMVMLHNPEYLEVDGNGNTNWHAPMAGFVKQLWEAWDAAINSEDGYTPVNASFGTFSGSWFGDYTDIDSFASYWICTEIMGNLDSGFRSRYAYMDLDGKLVFGPLWDFDRALASPITAWKGDNIWRTLQSIDPNNFFKELLDDPYVTLKTVKAYWNLRDRLESMVEEGGTLDRYAAQLARSGAANDRLWGSILGEHLVNVGKTPRSFEEDLAVVKNCLSNRILWLDEQFGSLDAAMRNLGGKSAHPYTKSPQVLLTVNGATTANPHCSATEMGADAVISKAGDPELVVSYLGKNAATVDVYVNGQKTSLGTEIAGKTATVTIPSHLLGADPDCPDLVSVICRNASGKTVATSYLSARYTRPKYDVTLHIGDDARVNSGNVKSYAGGTGVELPRDVVRPGYVFAGWYGNESCTGDAVTAIPATAKGAKEYWAKWVEHEHAWSKPTYTWSKTNASVTATRTCKKNCSNPTESETVSARRISYKKPTCTKAGSRSFISGLFQNSAFRAQTKNVKVPASGHAWDKGKVTTEATYTAKGKRVFTCKTCGAHKTKAIPKKKATSKQIAAASNLNTVLVSAKQVKQASDMGAKSITLGPKVRRVAAKAFAGTKIKTVIVKTRKLKAQRVKNAFKGSKVRIVKVRVTKLKSIGKLHGKKRAAVKRYNAKARKVNKRYSTVYRSFFTKKVLGKKVRFK